MTTKTGESKSAPKDADRGARPTREEREKARAHDRENGAQGSTGQRSKHDR